MSVKTAHKRPPERGYHKGSDAGSQYRMRCQYREVNGAYQALTREPRRTEPEVVGAQGMMSDVRNQKKRRDRTRRQHAQTMLGNAASHYEIEARDQAHGAESVQPGVQVREDRQQIHILLLFPESEQNQQHEPQSTHDMPVPAHDLGERGPLRD